MKVLVNEIKSNVQDSTIEGFLDKYYDEVVVEYDKLNNDQYGAIVGCTYKCYNQEITRFDKNSVKLD